MRYSLSQYAKIFSELLEKTPKNKQKEAIKEFAAMLEQNGDIKNSNDILYAIEQTLYEKSKSLKMEVAEAKNHHLNLPEKIGRRKVEVKKEIDPSLIGGIKIKIGDMVVDNSVRSRINELKNTFK